MLILTTHNLKKELQVNQYFNNHFTLCICIHIFILLRLNPLGQRKLPMVISLSRMLCFGRVCASCALNVSAALQGAYNDFLHFCYDVFFMTNLGLLEITVWGALLR